MLMAKIIKLGRLYNVGMFKKIVIFSVLVLALAACASPVAEPPEALSAERALPTPFPMSDGIFIGAPQDFLLPDSVVPSDYAAQDTGSESPNSRVLEGRPDGAAYIEATGRLNGYQIQFNHVGEGGDPLYIVQVVVTFENAEGATLALSREWHADVWNRIDSGEFELLPEIDGLDAEHMVWRDPVTGTVAVEMVYRNLYILLTGPSDGGDNYQFFADLAQAHLDWIIAGEG
jgi:hypothetical protein